MGIEELLEKAKEEAILEVQRAKDVCEKFQDENGRKPSQKEKKEIRGYHARMTSVVLDKKTDKLYTATSGYPPPQDSFHKLLKERMPHPSLESKRPPESCAEVKAANEALNSRADAQISDLVIATVLTKDGSPQVRCENCKVTLSQAYVITDEEL